MTTVPSSASVITGGAGAREKALGHVYAAEARRFLTVAAEAGVSITDTFNNCGPGATDPQAA
jgi:hypothetical protein